MIDVEEWLAVWNTRDEERIVALCQPDVEVTAVTLSAEARHYEGHDGVRKWVREVRSRFQALTRVERIEPVADDVVILSGTLLVDQPTSTEAVLQPFAILIHLRDDKAAWMGTFITPETAREAYELGVTGPGAG